jgi:hypothetical protein
MEDAILDKQDPLELEIEKYSEFRINTTSAYYLVKQHQDNEDIPHKNFVEFRERLEDVLPKYAQPSAKFHPLSWKYHRNKYKQWQSVKDYWKMKNSNVFDPYFFMSNALLSGEITYKSLTDDEKREVDKSLNEEGEDNLVRWAFDAYALWDDCPLTYQNHEEDFEFFFAWQLLLTDLKKIDFF